MDEKMEHATNVEKKDTIKHKVGNYDKNSNKNLEKKQQAPNPTHPEANSAKKPITKRKNIGGAPKVRSNHHQR